MKRKPKLAKLPPGIYTGVITSTSVNPSHTRLRVEMYVFGKGRIKQDLKLK